MTEVASFKPSRLVLARQRRGMTLLDLADAVALPPRSLSDTERGRRLPSAATLVKLAEVLDFPICFFSAPDIEELQDVHLSFRARSQTATTAKNAVRSAARIAVELNQWLHERFIAPAVDIPCIDGCLPPELVAEHVRARWGIGPLQPVPNCVHLLESRGVAVFSLPHEHRDVDAFSFWWRGTPFVMLSTTKTAEQSRFDAAHELGHLVMHRNADFRLVSKSAEQDADRFASAFLMPRAGVLRHMTRPVTTDRILRGTRRWQVAATALAHRCHQLTLLPEATYHRTVVELGRAATRSGESGGVIRESSQFLAKVVAALREDGMSLATVALELRLQPDEIRDLTFGLVLQSAGPDSPAGQPEHENTCRPDLRLVRSRSI